MRILHTSEPLKPVQKLAGLNLPGDWNVTEMVTQAPNATGGFFSVGYRVKHNKDGRKAFLKALDFSEAIRSSDPARKLQELTATFNFERDLLNKCKNKSLDRVVRAIEDGNIVIDGMAVPYLIFELADGDMRAHMSLAANLDLAWVLRMLHHVAVGLKQLHSVGIAHQDLKPSNVLVFGQNISKLADLGRSAHPNFKPPHDDAVIPGAWGYVPPELMYGFVHPDYNQRRFGCDAYLLGNIIMFAFTGVTASTMTFDAIAPEHKPNYIGNSYDQMLPYIQNAFNDALSSVEAQIPEQVRADIMIMLRQLCEPDLAKRGHPKNNSSTGNSFSLERFITNLNVLAYKAERKLF